MAETLDAKNAENLMPERTYTFTLDDSDASKEKVGVVTYTLRGLTDDEVKPWAQFCASIFAYKANPPPPEYFERHYFNDPLQNASLIRVAFAEAKTPKEPPQIVASCRIFQRHISDGKGGFILAGGIGEVCTSNDHRRRGLSRELLQDCIEIMNQCGMKASILHAAPAFFPVYRSMGYECTTSRWSLVDIQQSPSESSTETSSSAAAAAVICRPAKFPDDTATMKSLHQRFSENKFVGCIVRSEDYWNSYLSQELKGTLFVLENSSSSSSHPLLFAWLSLRPRGERWQLREFCYDAAFLEDCHITMAESLRLLLRQALPSEEGKYKVHLPTFILDKLSSGNDSDKATTKDWMDWDSVTEENDEGWMYRPIGDNGVSIVELSRTYPHLIWPADSF